MVEASEVKVSDRVGARIDEALAQLKDLSAKLDQASEAFARSDAAAVRRAFQAKEEGARGGG